MSRPKRPVPSGPVPDLASWLREHPSGSNERLSLTRDEVHVLFQELQRLHQSTDRLRKQNRKIRKRFLAARDGGALDDLDLDLDADSDGDGDAVDEHEEE